MNYLIATVCVFFVLGNNKISNIPPFLPPGTVQISEGFYADKTEISNKNWLEYLTWQKNSYGDTSSHYIKVLPDTAVWGQMKPYRDYYLRHPAFADYPVVGISHEQAYNFCKWRTVVVGLYYQKLQERKPKTYVPKLFRYRLPTRLEWEELARAGVDEKTQKDMDKIPGQPVANLVNSKLLANPAAEADTFSVDITAPVVSYWPNRLGLYNLFGNVAEMTREEGIAKGGGFIHRDDEVTAERNFVYNGPQKWLGFRCVCEILEE